MDNERQPPDPHPRGAAAAGLPAAEFTILVLGNLQDAAEHTFENGTAAELDARLGRPFQQVLQTATLAGIVP